MPCRTACAGDEVGRHDLRGPRSRSAGQRSGSCRRRWLRNCAAKRWRHLPERAANGGRNTAFCPRIPPRNTRRNGLAAEENVTNRLAEAFYRDHGVRQIERGLDLASTTAGHVVLRSAYCIRREIGECLREHPRLRGDLFLEHGAYRYRLAFDCEACEMSLVDPLEKREPEGV